MDFKSWNKKTSLETHVGKINSIHNQAKRKCEDLMRQEQSIHASIEKQSSKDKHGYRIRLATSIDVARFLVRQGLTFRDHDEFKSSLNRAKRRLQELRKDNKWDLFVSEVSTFCIKHNTVVPAFDELYVNFGRSRRKPADYTKLQELNDYFNEVTTELLHGVACFNTVDSFSSFDIQKIMRMTELYPDDFDELNMCVLKNHLANYIIDVRDIDKRKKKHSCYPLVFRLVKFALLLPVATASVERAFSAMKFIKNEL
ncbi:uncharacterized protein LOC124886564 [Capsicum annuum]|uniref:uncharacterized protein LOC124886564 n=1 Tax=Capsicum annuum TaxID=4072 RepID=UPI001FB0671A|nr:uncharacterized protein LOC124886564 [Capsicum annuum]